jgi:hypothetical protein
VFGVFVLFYCASSQSPRGNMTFQNCASLITRCFCGLSTAQKDLRMFDPSEKLAKEFRRTAQTTISASFLLLLCTKFCHGPVNGLHSIENKRVADACFSLTKKIGGVQQDRSLTVS